MKAKVNEDQGSIEEINKVVYGTCAVLIRAYNLSYEALSVTKGLRKDIPLPLIKIWKSAQKMRAYFDFGDVKAAVDRNASGSSKLKKASSRVYPGSQPGDKTETNAIVTELSKI